jgi:hypothetical protein
MAWATASRWSATLPKTIKPALSPVPKPSTEALSPVLPMGRWARSLLGVHGVVCH